MTRPNEHLHKHWVAFIFPVKGEDRVLCKSCLDDLLHTDQFPGLIDYVPKDIENYPIACELCGVNMYHPDQALPPE